MSRLGRLWRRRDRVLAGFDVRPLAGLAVTALVAWAGGFSLVSALLVGLVVAAAVVVLSRIDLAAEPRADAAQPDRRHGVRGEVQELSWAMVGRDRRIGERVLRRVREVGAVRLARHGLDLGSADDEDAIVALVGRRAHATLTHRASPLPSVADVRHTVDALDRLGPHRTEHHALPDVADTAVLAGRPSSQPPGSPRR